MTTSTNNSQENQEKKEKKPAYIFKIPHKKNFTVIDNHILYNRNLSAKATCYLCILLSFPDHWKINLEHLATLKTDGIKAVNSAINELKKHGYVFYYQSRSDGGRFFPSVYIVSETPKTKVEVEEFKKSLPQAYFGNTAKGNAANGRLVNTNSKVNIKKNKKQKEVASSDAPFLSEYFLKKLKEIRSNRPEPNWNTWNKDIILLMKQKNLTRQEVIALIDFATDLGNTFVVESPASLRRKYEKIADHIEIDKKRKIAQDTAKKDPRMAVTIKTIQDYTSRMTAGNMGNEYSFVINPDGGVYHTIERRNYPRNYDKFMEVLKDRGAPESMLLRIKQRVSTN